VALSTGQRLRAAAGIFGLGLVVGVLLLPIPLLHLVGLMVFLASTVFAVKRLRVRAVVERVRGGCPSCGAQTSFFVGAGHMAARWPLSSQCGACGIGVRFTPVNSAVR
jgi:ribosomal protein S27AE